MSTRTETPTTQRTEGASYRGGAGEPMVLVHGIGDTWLTWRPVLSALERNHDVLALDLPGFGVAPAPANGGAQRVLTLADAVEGQMEAAGFETAHLVGNSMGGAIVLELARRGRAKSVVAISPAGLGTPREWVYTKTVLATLRALARALSPAASALARLAPVRALMLATVCARGWKATPEQAVGEVRALAGAIGWDETLEALGRYRAQGLPDIRCPTLIMWGTLDLILPVRQAERFARLIPDARLQILPRLGHSPMTDDPELIARLINEHTQRAQSPGTA